MKKAPKVFRTPLYFVAAVFCLPLLLFFLVILPMNLKQQESFGAQVKIEDLYKDVEVLTSLEPSRNYKNLESLKKAQDYIKSKFKENCPDVELQKYEVEGVEYANVICRFTGASTEKIVVGAHFDVADEQAGADDNASGVAGLLALTKLIKENNPQMPYTLEFVAYTLEEPPYFRTKNMGSAVHAKQLKERSEKVKLMISLEMIGYFSDKENSQSYPFSFLRFIYPTEGNFIGIIGKIDQVGSVYKVKKGMLEGSNIEVISFSGPNIIPGMDFSDHLNYWAQGYNAVMITDTAFYRNPNYHERTDTLETLNFEKMAEVIQGVNWLLINY